MTVEYQLFIWKDIDGIGQKLKKFAAELDFHFVRKFFILSDYDLEKVVCNSFQ